MRSASVLLLLTSIAAVWGCGTATNEGAAGQPSSSVQTLEYYPELIKGYQNSYPTKRVLVLASVDAREFNDPTATIHAPEQGNPAIGVVLDANGSVTERLYTPPFLTVVRKAIKKSAEEAGKYASESNEKSYSGVI